MVKTSISTAMPSVFVVCFLDAHDIFRATGGSFYCTCVKTSFEKRCFANFRDVKSDLCQYSHVHQIFDDSLSVAKCRRSKVSWKSHTNVNRYISPDI
jgi:hypothetical protein